MSKSASIVKDIDHLIVAVADLDRSERRWQALGFGTTARGYHETGGTANHLIMLDGTYLELLGLAEPSASSPLRALIEGSPGLAGIAFRADARQAFELWRSQGLPVTPPSDLARGVDIDGRREMARFRITMMDRSDELPFLTFCCEHLTAQFVWHGRPEHRNGARRLRELFVLVDDAATQAAFERLTARAASADGAGCAGLSLDGSRITFLSAAALRGRFGADLAPVPGRPPRLAGFGLACESLEAVRREAQSGGWSVLRADGTTLAVQDPDDGLLIEWST